MNATDIGPETAHPGIVVVNFGGATLLAQNLATTASDLPEEAAVVVVDNYSNAANRADVESLCRAQGWSLVAPQANLGFGEGANLGIARAVAEGADVVCLINPDASLAPAGLRELLGSALGDRAALVAPRIVAMDGEPWFAGAQVDVPAGRTRRADPGDAEVPHPWLTGACLVFHRDAWTLTGGFDPAYFLYWEDVDLSWRHRDAGGRLHYRGDVVVRHDVSATQRATERGGRSPAYYHYNCRNRLVFAAKNLPEADQRRWARGSLGYAWEVLMRGGRRQLLRSPRSVLTVTRGTLVGLCFLIRHRWHTAAAPAGSGGVVGAALHQRTDAVHADRA